MGRRQKEIHNTMDSQSQTKQSSLKAWAIACGLSLLFVTAGPALAETSEPLRPLLPVPGFEAPIPTSLVCRKDNSWYYQMSDYSMHVYSKKLAGVADNRTAAEKMFQTVTFQRYRPVSKIIMGTSGTIFSCIFAWI